MLVLTIAKEEFFNEVTEEFVTLPEVVLELEHSLVSLSKWESKWERPFLGEEDRTDEESYDYIRCMTLTPAVPPETYLRLKPYLPQIAEYITAKMTATWFGATSKTASQETITAEIIYHWMIVLKIPVEFQYWHLNRLLTLIKVCDQKNAPAKKMTPQEISERNRKLNAERRAASGSKG